MTNVFSYNEESAIRAGGSDFVSEGGAHVCTIEQAKWIKANSGSKGLELSVKTQNGQKANYLSMYFQKADGTEIKSGMSCINAIMFFLKLGNLSMQQQSMPSGVENICPELTGKTIGLFLQKVLYTKNNGGDGYRFDIRAPYNAADMRTVKEIKENKPAQTIQNWVNSYSDKDDRNQGGGSHDYGQPPANQFPDDDIPGW